VRPRRGLALIAVGAVLAGACHGSGGSSGRSPASTGASGAVPTTTITGVPLGPAIVFSAQGSQLDAYATTRPFITQVVVPSPAADRDGVDVSGQICFDPTNPNQFVAADQTAAADGQSGWGVFEVSGHALGKLSAKESARLVPTYQPSAEGGAPFGCAFLPNGRLLTTDVGNPTTEPADGQLIEWFPPFDRDRVASCKIVVDLAAPQNVVVAGDHVYVAESGGRGVTSFAISALPESDQPTGGCARSDTAGVPLATGVAQTDWLRGAAATALAKAGAIVAAGNGNFYVSSPRTGVIAEVSLGGVLVRRILAPPAGEKLGLRPFSTGTPLGLGVGPDGTLYYSDSGLVVNPDQSVAPGLRTGTVRRITFVAGVPQPPEVVDSGLQSPAGIGIWIPKA
jgi:hypothetical protein